MTEQTEITEPAPASEEAELFTRAELKSFDADDIEAGSNICKMLSIFFFYTVVVMGISGLVTYSWISQ